MPQQLTTAVENNFTKGLITESTGLNFPENAATDCDNSEFTVIGNVRRRQGVDFETNFQTVIKNKSNQGIATYKWNNVGGDGNTQIVVVQIGLTLYFYRSSSATDSSPLSGQKLSTEINYSGFVAAGGVLDTSKECQFTDGNGCLIVTHPNCDPFFCVYNPITTGITVTAITLQTRDFIGTFPSEYPISFRPGNMTLTHQYNVQNQGWNGSIAWSASSASSATVGLGLRGFNIGVVSGVVAGQTIGVIATTIASSGVPGSTTSYYTMVGNVVSYAAGIVSIYVGTYDTTHQGTTYTSWSLANITGGSYGLWFNQVGNYPANSDVWWNYKDSLDLFNPATTLNSTTLNTGPAPKGSYILSEFAQDRAGVSGVTGIPVVSTTIRPKTAVWNLGRVFYTGVDAPNDPSTNYSWSENIYFSQITLDQTKFGYCYQENDPTSSKLFDLLPTDGGVITIAGSGSIFKLFPIQNGMLVFAANGVWFITGSQGIGFAANDYTITKISSVRSISSYSFVDVNGLPYFWNEEGIYAVGPQQGGGLTVNPITVGTILTFYNSIPTSSKKYARGAYDPLEYVIKWVYRDTEESNVTDRYIFNKVLNFNTYNKAFFPYTVDTSNSAINSIVYVSSPGGLNTPDSTIKYLVYNGLNMSFANEHEGEFVDWQSQGGINYEAFFVTGYKLRGQAIKKFQPQYIQVYCAVNGEASSYKIQGIWDYSNDRSSGKWSNIQLVTNGLTRFNTVSRRHKIRGHGYTLQFKVTSVDGMPFDIQGWAVVDTVNQGT